MKILDKLIEKEDLQKYIKLRSNFIKSCIYTTKLDNPKYETVIKEYNLRLSELDNLNKWLKTQWEK